VDAQQFLREKPQPGDCSQPLGALPRVVPKPSSLGWYQNRKPQLLRVSGREGGSILPVSPAGEVLSSGLMVKVWWWF